MLNRIGKVRRKVCSGTTISYEDDDDDDGGRTELKVVVDFSLGLVLSLF